MHKLVTTFNAFGNPVKCEHKKDNVTKVLFTAEYSINGSVKSIIDNCEEIKYNYKYNKVC